MIKKFPTKKISRLGEIPYIFNGLPWTSRVYLQCCDFGPTLLSGRVFWEKWLDLQDEILQHGGHHPTNRHCCRHPFRLIFRSGPERFGCCLCLGVSVRNGDGSEITRIRIVEVGSLSHDLRGFSSIPGGYFGIFWIVSSMNKGTEKNQLSNKKKHSCLGYTVYSGMKYTS